MRKLLGIGLAFSIFIAGGISYGAITDEAEAKRILGRPFYTGAIIPQPQNVKYKDSFISLLDWQKGEKRLCIVIGKKASKEEKTAAEVITKRINRLLPEDNKVEVLTDKDDYSIYPVVIAIGTQKTNSLVSALCRKNRIKVNKKYPGKEGYILRLVKNKNQKVLLCAGSDGRGSYYAVQSLSQMLNIRGPELTWQEVEVVDYPYFDMRMAAHKYIPNRQIMDFLGNYKMNWLSVEWHGWWQELPPGTKKAVRDAMDIVKKAGICEGIGIQVRSHDPLFSKDKRTLRASRPEDIKALRETVHFFVENGVSLIGILQDDWMGPSDENGYALYPEDKGHFKNLAESQVYLMNQVAEEVRASNPKCRLVYCPPYYSCVHCGLKQGSHMKDVNNSLPGAGESFLQEVGKGFSPEIEIYWTGPEVKSFKDVRAEDITYLSKLTGHKVFYWANTIQRYKPFATGFPDNFRELVSGVHWHGVLNWSLLRLAYIPQADYIWNTKGYDAERSFKNAIGSYYGPGMYEPLIHYGDLSWKIQRGLNNPDINKEERRRLLEELKKSYEQIKEIARINLGENSPGYREFVRGATRKYQLCSEGVEAAIHTLKLSCPKIELKQPFDGTLKEELWKKAAKTSNFLKYRSGKEAKEKTYSLIGYDDKNLYIGFSCKASIWVPEENLSKIHDWISLENDIVEIFLDPGRDYKYYHFLMNRIGTVKDQERAGLGLGNSWNPVEKYEIKTHKEKDRWTLEMAIPFTALGRKAPKKGEVWGANFCREYKSVKEISAWSWSPLGFHMPSAFGYLIFD